MLESEPLPYRFGWFTAWAGLAMAPDVQHVRQLAEYSGLWAGFAAGVVHVYIVLTGFAAAAVRPWAWYVLIGWPTVLVLWGIVYAAFIALTPRDVWMVLGATVALPPLIFTYYYRRREMFGAAWRWRWAEAWWPRLTSPASLDPAARPGFAGLSASRRRLFVASLLVWWFLLLAGLR
jgi:hypothetical protein